MAGNSNSGRKRIYGEEKLEKKLIRITPTQKAKAYQAAKRNGKNFSEWLRDLVNAAS